MENQIEIECPFCKGDLMIDPAWIGRKMQCPYCERKFVLSELPSEQTDASHAEPVQSASDEWLPPPLSQDQVADKSSFRGKSRERNLLVLVIAGVLFVISLIVLGLVFVGGSNSTKDGGHKGVQLWEDGPYWAETNIGAEKPEDYGYYFWWGDTVGYKHEGDSWVANDESTSNFKFHENNTPTYGKSIDVLKSDRWLTKNEVLAPKYDAAHVHWGGDWRMPTAQELRDLEEKCDWEWTTKNGVHGYIVRGKGKYTSACIFLPCAGRGLGTSLSDAGSDGNYWSSVPSSVDDGNLAWALYFDSGDLGTSRSYVSRYSGRSVRPVQGFTNTDGMNNISSTPHNVGQSSLGERSAEEQYSLGMRYFKGEGVKKNRDEAVKLFRKAAEQGHAEAQGILGACYCMGEGVPEDMKEAVKWLRKAAEQGVAGAQCSLGALYYEGEGVKRDRAEAVRLFRKAAEQGYAEAQFSLAKCYAQGVGVEQDSLESARWYRKAAGQGHAESQVAIGVLFYAAKDFPEAIIWFRLAAHQGHAEAQLFLGGCYFDGNGVEKNWREAVKWYQKAAAQGLAEAQCCLGKCYSTQNNQGVNVNLREAVKWFRKAAEQGNVEAQFYLGLAYIQGQGVATNRQEGIKWLRKAALQDGEFAHAAQNVLQKVLKY